MQQALDYKHWVIGFSGGLDSTVLLHLAHDFIQQQNRADKPLLSAVHIHHGLHTAAKQWRGHCADICYAWNIPLLNLNAKVTKKNAIASEAQARTARYTAFKRHLKNEHVLLLAHHANDQTETLLLRLNRGSGTRGLSAIPEKRPLGQSAVLRPLLRCQRTYIKDYAQYHDLVWIDDPSNDDINIDRNFIRHKIFPLLDQRWRNWQQTWCRAIDLLAESEQLNQDLARIDWQAKTGTLLSRDYLCSLDGKRVANLLRWRLHELGLRPPVRTQLQEFIRQIHQSAMHSKPQLQWQDGKMYISKQQLIIDKG